MYAKDAESEFLTAFNAEVLPPELCPSGTGRWITVRERYDMLLRDVQKEQEQAQPQEMAAEVGSRPIEVIA